VQRFRGYPGLHYDPRFLKPADRAEIMQWLSELVPLWEKRFSLNHPPPPGKENRPLLRPVYWLGNWQFACLGYYHPPKGTRFRCVQAEPFPPVLFKLVLQMQNWVKRHFPPAMIPSGWHLNTCLVNLYGMRTEAEGKPVDTARVGEHKDFEPGPVASLSLGERAMFQFVSSQGKGRPSRVVFQQWLEDGSLQIFGGDRWKNQLFHRVQRVEKKGQFRFPLVVENFSTRRVNFTFRYVPPKDIVPWAGFPLKDREDTLEYMKTLAENSEYFASALKDAQRSY
jgi:DNA oxidative demethylase